MCNNVNQVGQIPPAIRRVPYGKVSIFIADPSTPITGVVHQRDNAQAAPVAPEIQDSPTGTGQGALAQAGQAMRPTLKGKPHDDCSKFNALEGHS